MVQTPAEWAEFFQALADENRVKIIGLLAQRPMAVEELAACLDITPATVSHHLRRLRAAHLVEARALQYYSIYALRTTGPPPMAAPWNALAEQLRQATPLPPADRFGERVLKEYLVHGRVRALPGQVLKRLVILRRLAAEFQGGKRYSEKQIDAVLARFFQDAPLLRRELVQAGLLASAGAGYWRAAAQATWPPTGSHPG